MVVRLFAAYFGFVLAEPLAFILCLAGTTVLVGGFLALRWAWPAIVFLVFMIPLPGALAGRLGGPLQHLATLASTYVLQTLGIPAVASGNVICLTHGRIGVAEACNGLGMLTTLAAVTVAAVFLLKLSAWENVCVLASSVVIAIVANIFRIAATGVVQELIGVEFAKRVFHDFAGLVMVPLVVDARTRSALVVEALSADGGWAAACRATGRPRRFNAIVIAGDCRPPAVMS